MFFRRLTGIGNAYAAFMFPASMPVNEWLYALPDIAYCLCTFKYVILSISPNSVNLTSISK